MNLKNLLIALVIEFIYLILTIYWLMEDTINYGIGLGALFFFYISIGSSFLLLILFIIASTLKNKTKAKKLALISLINFTLICLFNT